MKNIKIRTKLLIIVLVAIIPMIILNGLIIISQRHQVIAQEQNASRDYAEAVGVAFTNYLEMLWTTQLAIGLSIIDSPTSDSTQINAYLEKCRIDYPTVRSFAFTNPKGEVLYSTNPTAIGLNLSDRDYYERIVNGEEKVVSNLVISKAVGISTLGVARGILENGELRGIVIFAVDIEKLELVLPHNRLGKTSNFGIVDGNGMIVYRLDSPNLTWNKEKY